MTGIVIGVDLREFLPEKLHFICPSCACKNENSFFGWWMIQSDYYKDEGGKPHVMIEYPPAWKRVKT